MSFQVSRIRRKNEDSESQIEQQLRSWDVRTRYHRMPRIPGVGSELSEVKTDAVLLPTGTVETERDDPKQLYPLADDIGLEAGPCSQPSLSSCATMRHQGGERQRTDHLKEQLLIVCSPQLRRSFEEGWARGPCGMMGRCGGGERGGEYRVCRGGRPLPLKQPKTKARLGGVLVQWQGSLGARITREEWLTGTPPSGGRAKSGTGGNRRPLKA